MTFAEYQAAAARTINNTLLPGEKELHALHGMASEIGEIHGLYQKVYQGHQIDAAHIMKEVGDLLWFVAEYCTACGWPMDTVAQTNIDKLIARYPEGFEEERSLHRAENDL